MSTRKFYITVRKRADGGVLIEEAGTLTEMAGQLFASPTYPAPMPERIFDPRRQSSSRDLYFSSEAQWRLAFINAQFMESSSNESKA